MVTELEQKRDEKLVAGYDDERLVFGMLAMLAPYEHKQRGWLLGGQTEAGAVLTRTMFLEICARWIPPDVIGPAFTELETVLEGSDNA